MSARSVGGQTGCRRNHELWYSLCEYRVRFQKILRAGNIVLHQSKPVDLQVEVQGAAVDSLQAGYRSVMLLLRKLLDFQLALMKTDGVVCDVLSCESLANDNDEEVSCSADGNAGLSSTDDELEEGEVVHCGMNEILGLKLSKTKHNSYNDILGRRHKAMAWCRNAEIQKWNKKAQLDTEKTITKKPFVLVRRSLLQEIDQECPLSKQFDAYEHHVFDDADFYEKLLKDVIGKGTEGMRSLSWNKPIAFHRFRSKMKYSVDAKASKGRKIRFDVHPKLVNFSTPVICMMSAESRNELFRSLFGPSPAEEIRCCPRNQ